MISKIQKIIIRVIQNSGYPEKKQEKTNDDDVIQKLSVFKIELSYQVIIVKIEKTKECKVDEKVDAIMCIGIQMRQ